MRKHLIATLLLAAAALTICAHDAPTAVGAEEAGQLSRAAQAG